MKTLALILAVAGIAAVHKLESPKGKEQSPRPVVSPVYGVPLPIKAMSANTNEHPGWVGLGWTYSPSPEVAGYFVYQGTNSRSYYTRYDVGLGTNITQWPQCLCPTNRPQTTGCAKIFNLEPGRKYYFTVTAYAGALESDYSNEVDFTYRLKTNTTLTVFILAGPAWAVYTNLPPRTNATGAAYFRTVADGATVAVQSAPSYSGPWTGQLFFPHTNTAWKLQITRTNW